MKICKTCNISKKEAEFHKRQANRDGLQSHCKECRNKSRRENPRTNQYAVDRERCYREKMNNLKISIGCQVCGYNKTHFALHFHHLNPAIKKYTIAAAIHKVLNREKMIEELKKCIVVCGNCHGEIELKLLNVDDYPTVDATNHI